MGVAIADIGAWMYATQSILVALLRRELSDSGGQKVDISPLDGQLAWMSYIAPYQAFPTWDGYAVVAVFSQNLWPKFCAALERADLTDDDRFETDMDCVNNYKALNVILESETRKYTIDELVAVKEDDVPATSVRDMEEVFKHPQVRAREIHQTVKHPTIGRVSMPGVR